MLKKILIGMMVLGMIAVCTSTQASTFSFSLGNLADPSGFEAFILKLDVADDFTYSVDSLVFGTAIPDGTGAVLSASKTPSPNVILDWTFANENPSVMGNMFIVEAWNNDLFDTSASAFDFGGNWLHTADGKYSENNLLNGVLFSFDYDGTINGLNLFRVGDSSGEETTIDELIATGINYKMDLGGPIVPVPSSLLLLGGGICALLGINRRKK